MPETSARRHQVPASGEHPSREGWVLAPLRSVNDIVPVTNEVDRAVLVSELTDAGDGPTTARPLYVHLASLDVLQFTTNGTSWKNVGGQLIGDEALSSQVLLTADWSDVLTVSGAAQGRRCIADWNAIAFNGASGADRTVKYRMLLDGSVLGPTQLGPFEVPLRAGNIRIPVSFQHRSTPGAGNHTWKLQAQASFGTSVYVEQAVLTVTEKP